MKIHITEDKKIEISMKDQIKEAFQIFGEELIGSVTSPATKKIMAVNPNAIHLNNNNINVFH